MSVIDEIVRDICDLPYPDDGQKVTFEVGELHGILSNHLECRPIETAPKDGSLLILKVRNDDDSAHPTEDEDVFRTIGFNNLSNTGEDCWQMAGWCWCHDHFTETKGTPVGWWPLPPVA